LSSDDALLLGIDVGTQSARAGIFTTSGELVGRGEHELAIWRPRPDHVEQSSSDIWRAVCAAVRAARADAGVQPSDIAGLGFDATCSLVAVDRSGGPVTVSLDGGDDQDVIVWMDHRAVDDAVAINATDHAVLGFVGGTVSPEMQTPKLRWIREHLPETWKRTVRWFDLADYLTWRSTRSEQRSLCTTTCKWTYLGHEDRWDPTFFVAANLAELARDGFAAIGAEVGRPGARVGGLTPDAAAELGLDVGTAVATSLIDAHSGALGMIGSAGHDAPLDSRLAVIAGTSACHLALSRQRIDVPGVWGPYWGALLPDRWLLEAGISASGSFLDLVLLSHPASRRFTRDAHAELEVVLRAAGDPAHATRRTRHLLLQPNVLGNRAPLADPTMTGGVAGWQLRDDVDDLARWYLAAVQALAYATRHIVDVMRAAGARVELLVCCGGSASNEWWLRSHADALGVPVAVPEQPDAVLLGAAMLGSIAAGTYSSFEEAMAAMTSLGRVVVPDAQTAAYHDAKYRVYRKMIDDGTAYRSMMEAT
jgi:FGGY-family pentulose kinase